MLLLALVAVAFTSCSVEPDAEKFSSYQAEMMSDFLKNNPQYSEFENLVQRAGLMDQLATYGHYTLFVPTNEAMQGLYAKRGIGSAAQLTDADCDTIVRTHIIEGRIYHTSDMADGVLASQNMLNRNVQVEHVTDAEMNSVVVVNRNSYINYYHQNDSVENGIVHEITVALENSTKTVGSLLGENTRLGIYADAIHLTELDKKLERVEDMEYRQRYNDNVYTKKQDLRTGSRNPEAVYCPAHKYYGFTAFVVPDDVLAKKYNVHNVHDLYVLAAKLYAPTFPQDVSKEGWKEENITDSINPLRRFLAYHILDRNCNGSLTVRDDAGVDVSLVNPTEWYTTMLPYSLIKVEKLTCSKLAYVGSIMNDYYLNRRVDEKGKYREPGVHLSTQMEAFNDNNSLNGMYYYIDDILVWDDNVRNIIHNDRMRLDFSTVFPEIQTNNFRMNGPHLGQKETGKNYWFPQGYLDGVILRGDSRLTYWYPQPGYYSMNGDEMDAQKTFDITFNIPPVPFTGEWQLRLGFAPMSKSDGAERGQVQIYVDDVAQGIPLNMEERLNAASIYSGTYTEDYDKIRDDKDKRTEDFKILKNKGYYRGPYSVFNSSNGKISGIYSRFASNIHMARKVLCTLNLKAGETHTIRIKNVSAVLPGQKEAMLDYLEIVPKSIYGVSDGDNAEDDL